MQPSQCFCPRSSLLTPHFHTPCYCAHSHYLEDNLATYGQRQLSGQQLLDVVADEDFAESNLMHNINGFMYGNNVDIVCKDQPLRWCVLRERFLPSWP